MRDFEVNEKQNVTITVKFANNDKMICTLCKKNRMNFKPSSVFQPLRQLLKMTAVNVEVNSQSLPASLGLICQGDIYNDIKCSVTP